MACWWTTRTRTWPDNVPLTVQDLIDILLTLPEEARRVTKVIAYDGDCDGGPKYHVTRREVTFDQKKWTLAIVGDSCW